MVIGNSVQFAATTVVTYHISTGRLDSQTQYQASLPTEEISLTGSIKDITLRITNSINARKPYGGIDLINLRRRIPRRRRRVSEVEMQQLVHECVHLIIPQPTPTAWEAVPNDNGTDRRLIGRHERLLGHVKEVRAEEDPFPIGEVQRQTRGPAPVVGTFIPHVASAQDGVVDDFVRPRDADDGWRERGVAVELLEGRAGGDVGE